MFESGARSGLSISTRRHILTLYIISPPAALSSHFFNRGKHSSAAPRSPIFLVYCNKHSWNAAKWPISSRFSIKIHLDSLQCRCRGGKMVLCLTRAMPFFGSRTAFCQSAGQAARRGRRHSRGVGCIIIQESGPARCTAAADSGP